MAYQDALGKAWAKILTIKKQANYSVEFLADEYTINTTNKSVISLSCNIPSPDHITILILHYLIKEIEGLPKEIMQWISFPELDGGKGYYPTFKKRAIDPILRKFANSPEGLLTLIERFSAKRVQIGDFGIVIYAFLRIPVLITLWRSDEEFSTQVNMLFDASIKNIFPTEDIVVLAGLIAANI
ncbi:MAG: DUF3786 domain-containing protein [Candidatus Omnitrophota bacterium]|nr:DUF3786 domain-containing protein [Candidatus Omnitrophota bacterium]